MLEQITGDEACCGWNVKLDRLVLETFAEARVASLYPIIADYPDSAPAVIELRQASKGGKEGGERVRAGNMKERVRWGS